VICLSLLGSNTINIEEAKPSMADLQSKTYYDLLGLQREASIAEIKAAYKEIARIFHPDSHFYDDLLKDAGITSDNNALEQETFKQITAAYNTLVNEELRRSYDQMLPKGLRDWDDQSGDRLKLKRRTPFGTPPGGGAGNGGSADAAQSSAYAFGVFGVNGDNPRSAFDEAVNLRPMSEVMKQPRRGVIGAIWGWLRGE